MPQYRDIVELLDDYEALGIATAATPVIDRVGPRVRDLQNELNNYLRDLEQVNLVADVIDHKRTLGDAVEALLLVHRYKAAARGRAADLVRTASSTITAGTVAELRAIADVLLAELRQAIDHDADVARQLAGVLDGIDHDAQAIAAGTKVASVWAKVSAAAAHARAVTDLAYRLVRLGVLPMVHPHRRDLSRDEGAMHPARLLITATTDPTLGVGPYTDHDLEHAAEQHDDLAGALT